MLAEDPGGGVLAAPTVVSAKHLREPRWRKALVQGNGGHGGKENKKKRKEKRKAKNNNKKNWIVNATQGRTGKRN